MIYTTLIVIFFGYLLPAFLVKILLAGITSDEFNNTNFYKTWSLYCDRQAYNDITIQWYPFINLFLLFRLLGYKIFKK